ncbi:MAG: FAD-dependent oxidoreductase, partial [Sedimentisphaerales bacterium]|nr:FAD-dependent oxidoreductase [Sedimentisphaerales bacterium]
LHGVNDAEGIKAVLEAGKAHDVVILGGGLIGVEITEALARKGCRVTIVEKRNQILHDLDWEMAKLVELHLESHGVKVLTNTIFEGFQGDGRIRGVQTSRGVLPADLAILALGIRPNAELARQAGLAIGPLGGVKVDSHMRTSDPDIYAAGDCVESVNFFTQQPCYEPFGSIANKQGRIVATNLCGAKDTFPATLHSVACQVFEYGVARSGLNEQTARDLGYEVTTVLAPSPDREHFVPGAKTLMLKLVVDTKSRQLLGAQAIGPGHPDKRIDVATMAIGGRMTVDQVANLDLCYAPRFSPVMDNLITAANIARNKLDGAMVGITPMELHRRIVNREDILLLDVRTHSEYEQERLSHSRHIPLGILRERMGELPKDKLIVAFCNISLRGYEAALILRAAGFADVRVLDGGLDMWPYEKLQ